MPRERSRREGRPGARAARLLLALAPLLLGMQCPGKPLVINGAHVDPSLHLPATFNGVAWRRYWTVTDERLQFEWAYFIDLTDDTRRVNCDICQIDSCFGGKAPAIPNVEPIVQIQDGSSYYLDGCPGQAGAFLLPALRDPVTLIARVRDRAGGEIATDSSPTTYPVHVVAAGGHESWEQPLAPQAPPSGGPVVEYTFSVVGPDGSWTDNFSNRITVSRVHAVRSGTQWRIRRVRFGDSLSCWGQPSTRLADGLSIRPCRLAADQPEARDIRYTPAYRVDIPTSPALWSVQFDADPASPFHAPPAGSLSIVFDLQAEGTFVPPPVPPSSAHVQCAQACRQAEWECIGGGDQPTGTRSRSGPTPAACAATFRACVAACPR